MDLKRSGDTLHRYLSRHRKTGTGRTGCIKDLDSEMNLQITKKWIRMSTVNIVNIAISIMIYIGLNYEVMLGKGSKKNKKLLL